MDYREIYNQLILKAQIRADIPCLFEKHHILPKSMGGTNKKENIVFLSPREHYIAHHLLWKIYKNREMNFAFWCMITKMGRLDKTLYRVTSRIYNDAKERHRLTSSEMHTGKIPWNRGLKDCYSEETIQKMSNARIGFIETEETRHKKSVSHTGKKRGPSPLKGRSMPIDEKWNIICPHCAKVGKVWNMKRYHLENCKIKGEKFVY